MQVKIFARINHNVQWKYGNEIGHALKTFKLFNLLRVQFLQTGILNKGIIGGGFGNEPTLMPVKKTELKNIRFQKTETGSKKQFQEARLFSHLVIFLGSNHCRIDHLEGVIPVVNK